MVSNPSERPVGIVIEPVTFTAPLVLMLEICAVPSDVGLTAIFRANVDIVVLEALGPTRSSLAVSAAAMGLSVTVPPVTIGDVNDTRPAWISTGPATLLERLK